MSDRFSAPISRQIWGMKYQHKDAFTGEVFDETVEDTWLRIARALAAPEKDPAKWELEFYEALSGFEFLPAGRIIAGAGTDRNVTLFNCYVMGTIPDSMGGIFDSLKEAALTMQQGGGIGYDFSPLRPKGAPVKGVAADASGPLTFMDVWDAMCRTVMSAGTRRGAMMATMRCDHPDILEFISTKADPQRLRMFNLSVLCTDEFMDAVRADTLWELCHEVPPLVGPWPDRDQSRVGTDGKTRWVYGVIGAKDLWEKIMQSTYDFAEPGVIFVDRINQKNNLGYMENISATNPCGEQPLPPYGACLLGSINLAAIVADPFTDHARIDKSRLEKLVRVAVRMMDNVNDVSLFPLEQQRDEALNKRRIGLGVTGLADALIMCGLTYGTLAAAEQAESWSKMIAVSAYWTSVGLAREKGPFPALVASEYLREDTFAAGLPDTLQRAIRQSGIRNSHLLSIAPCGTISLYAGNVSSGIEPVFAHSYSRKVLQKDGSRTEEVVMDYAVSQYHTWRKENNVQDKDLPDCFVSAQTLKPLQHVLMQAAVQKWVDTSISKTVNVPEDINFTDFQDIYWSAFDSGCKGCTTYRPNKVTGSILTVEEAEEPLSSQEVEGPRGDITAEELLQIASEFLSSADRTERKKWMRQWLANAKCAKVVDLGEDRWGDFADAMDTFCKGTATGLDTEKLAMAAYIKGTATGLSEERWVDMAGDAAAPRTGPPNEVKTSFRVVGEDPDGGFEGFSEPEQPLSPRPDVLPASVYKVKIGAEPTFYVTIADIEQAGVRRPFEMFISTKNPEHIAWTTALTLMVSAIFRRPHDSSFVVGELKSVFDPRGGGFWKGSYRPSVVAAVGQVIQDHMASIGYGAFAQEAIADEPERKPYEKTMETRPTGPICQKCFSHNVKHEAGCDQCLDCGHSKCG